MYGPRVFISMAGTLVVFAVATFFLTNSLSTTLIETLICAVLLQIGYFAGILFLVWKAHDASSRSGRLPSMTRQFSWRVTRGSATHRGDDTPAPVQAREEEKSTGLPSAGLNRPDPFKH